MRCWPYFDEQENGENGEGGGSPSKKESPSKAKKAKKSFFPPDHLFKYELEELEDESSDEEEEEDDDDEVQEVGENGEKKKKQKEPKTPEVKKQEASYNSSQYNIKLNQQRCTKNQGEFRAMFRHEGATLPNTNPSWFGKTLSSFPEIPRVFLK